MSLWKDKAFVNGQWVAAASGKTFDVRNPLNGQVVGTVPDMAKEDTDKAIDAAAEVQIHNFLATAAFSLGKPS